MALSVLPKQIGKHPTRVFIFFGEPITQVNTKAWTAALKRAGIENFKWHDLRHTFATWHRQAGTPTHELQRLGGSENRGDRRTLLARCLRSLAGGSMPDRRDWWLRCSYATKTKDLAISRQVLVFTGGPCVTRTRDLRIKSPLLYQLS